MKVIKRNGRTEELDVSKIKKCTSDAVKDLEGVNLSELELDAKIQFRDGISTE
ncbi:ATP cone domain-containing protein, partial [Campylobacter jejuni]